MTRGDVVQQDYSAVPYLRQPGAEVVSYSFVGMKAIDVQKIDRAVIELRECIVEASPQKIGELSIVAIVIVIDLVENLFAIKASVLVSLPMIHGVTQAREVLLFDGLAKSEVSFAPMRAKFDD